MSYQGIGYIVLILVRSQKCTNDLNPVRPEFAIASVCFFFMINPAQLIRYSISVAIWEFRH